MGSLALSRKKYDVQTHDSRNLKQSTTVFNALPSAKIVDPEGFAFEYGAAIERAPGAGEGLRE